ncbi:MULTISPECIES: hypothetical protein [Kribbella]|jgi:hypothetical protein|uniref:Uncharacterized protein n=1 Tax=Kribbella pratensis TaxID=2512112 RepID=A0ABY2FHF3_9ACTN|nr:MULTISPECIES: hypothetical protein [Kribbella]TDW90639.1 hypothetical protein EV137_4461 [Kribbella pratensis]TDW98371.1 hypothetical protein EV647_3079 [Kribbella sp. VKM Ac-2566]
MVLFDSSEELHLFDPGALTPAPHVSEHIPDAGAFFVDWATRGLSAERAREIESAVNGRRNQNGWFPLESLDTIGRKGFWRGPLTYLARMTADDARIVQVWATDGLGGNQASRIEATVDHLLHQQGHAAAATWAVAVRPRTYLDPEVLGDRLLAAWEYNLGSIRAKDVAKSVRRWNR